LVLVALILLCLAAVRDGLNASGDPAIVGNPKWSAFIVYANGIYICRLLPASWAWFDAYRLRSGDGKMDDRGD